MGRRRLHGGYNRPEVLHSQQPIVSVLASPLYDAQVLYEIMVREIIPDVPESVRDEWKSAADTWRLPYWDWAQKKSRPDKTDPEGKAQKLIYDVPLIAKEPTIQVLDYKQADVKTLATVDNPMFKFSMPGNAQMGSFGINDVQDQDKPKSRFYTVPYSKSRTTSRWANSEPQGGAISEAWVDGTVNNDCIADALEAHEWYNKQAEGVPLAEMVYRLFEPEYIKSFAQFATTRMPTKDPKHWGQTYNPTGYLNLEFIHNNVHLWTGGIDKAIGHMRKVPVAGFDPIFFMHHCNIDRQFAIWQALNENNPDKWFDHLEKPYDDDGTWSIAKGENVSPKTHLAPFHKNAQGDCFDSDDIRQWMPFGYSYPELQPWLEKYKTDDKFDEAKYFADIRAQLKALYQSPESPTVSGWLTESLNSDVIVNITYDRFAFNGLPYTIYLFLGDKSTFDNYSGPAHKHPQLVGFVYTFSNPVFGVAAGGRGCKNCEKESEEGALSSAQIPLTAALVARQKATDLGSEMGSLQAMGIHRLDGMEGEQVEKYLEKYLHWSVKTERGKDIEVSDDQSSFFEIKVHHRASRFDDHESDAVYSPLERATQAKPGGYLYKGVASGSAETLPTR
ncbi:common central domain of tyrosinase-domain-containing protein [Cladorrhinum sp. PSN259]|nr:common central domain of tyrosinase-domain-containing protein [Cladorrhinum sp. PSN259]